MEAIVTRLRAMLLEPNPSALYQSCLTRQERLMLKGAWLKDAASSKPPYVLYPRVSVVASTALPITISDALVIWKFLWMTVRPLDCLMQL